MADANDIDWAGASSAAWLLNADRLEAQLQPVEDLVFEAAALAPGERVLDVGCGRGTSTRRAAQAVGPDGAVVAVDIAQGLLDAAGAIEVPGPAAPITWTVADAQTAPLPTSDVVLSRFGVMFFADAVAAFTNLRTTGGRLAVAVWQHRSLSSVHALPAQVISDHLAAHDLARPVLDEDGGPFSLGTAEVAADVLGRAGWSDVSWRPTTVPVWAGGPGCSPEEATEVILRSGLIKPVVDDLPASVAETLPAAMTAAYASRWDGEGIRLDAAIAILTARA